MDTLTEERILRNFLLGLDRPIALAVFESGPAQLSGGETDRLRGDRPCPCQNPKLLLCDEPTGALDYNTGKGSAGSCCRIPAAKRALPSLSSHNQAITAMADRIITVKNGTVTDMRKNEHIVPVEQIEW